MKKVFLIILCLVSILTMSSCFDAKHNDGIVITDAIGREVTVNPGTYNRIACIGAGALRLYSYIGDVNKLCAVEDIDNEGLTDRPKMFDAVARPYFIAHKDVFKNLATCGVGGPMAQRIEDEKLLAVGPDLIISLYEDASLAKALEQKVGAPVITLRYGTKGVFDEALADSISLLGKVLALDSKAQTLLNFINDEKEAIENRVKDSVPTKKAYICGLGNWGTTNELMTAQNYEPFKVANINNVISDLVKDGIQAIDQEKFASIADDIDLIFIDAAAIKNISSLEVFKDTKAYKNGEIYLQMAYNAYYTNIEIALINTWFNAKCYYPELFVDIDMTAKTNEITKAFLGQELAEEIFSYKYSFNGYQKIDLATFGK